MIREAPVLVCYDVRTPFAMAAEVFGPQKGASPEQVVLLTKRLRRLQTEYQDKYGVDLTDLPGAGAAGGLAGGLAAMGATLVHGFDLIANETGLQSSLQGADLVITGEGQLDAGSFNGKVVGGICHTARRHSKPALAILGSRADHAPENLAHVSLLDTYGHDRAWFDTAACIEHAVSDHLNHREPIAAWH